VWDLYIFIADSGYRQVLAVMKIDVAHILHERGYEPTQAYERVLATTALASLSVLGAASVKALLFHMSALTGIEEKALLSNYKEFERALWAALGSGADIILKHFSDELARNIKAQDMGTTEVIEAMKRDQPYVFMRNTTSGEHTLLLYRNVAFRDRMLAAFFEPMSDVRETRAAVFSQQVQIPSVSSVTFADLGADKSNAGEKTAEWALAEAGQGRLRLAVDGTWLAENGAQVPLAKLKDAALLSACDLRVGVEEAAKAAQPNYIVLEDTKAVYVKK
jgi:hypothetical protein